ncbi:hypothetical protein [Marivita sp.]|uniref:hypothetical protein n=1 Tax=Marivita sp. TaxID=2003365 RepID=UPI0025C01B60|nr:hypothetical protein [Marivita sp.]
MIPGSVPKPVAIASEHPSRTENSAISGLSGLSNGTAAQLYGANLRDRFVHLPVHERNSPPMNGKTHD